MSNSSEERDRSQVTMWLMRAASGDEQARDHAYRLVRDQLKRIAGARMSHEDGLSLSISEVADDAYLKLVNLREVGWQDRQHFLRYACTIVRQLLTDHARRRLRSKRNSGQRPKALDNVAEPSTPQTPEQVLALDEALERLEQAHPDLAEVVELQHFGGWTQAEIATEILNVPLITVRRRWTQARTLLHAWLSENSS